MDITQLLAFSVKNKASDLHLSAGLPPMIRVHGDVRRINIEPLDHKQVHAMVYDIMNDAQRKHYEDTLEWARTTTLPDGRRVIDQEWVQLNLARVRAGIEFLADGGPAVVIPEGGDAKFNGVIGLSVAFVVGF